MSELEVGKVYRELGGDKVLVVRDVPRNEYRAFVDPMYQYVEVVNAFRPDHSLGWRRKHDGRYPLYALWPQHPNHVVLEE